MVPGSLTRLVKYWKTTQAEFIWFPFWFEDEKGNWVINDAERFEHGRITTGSALYINWLKNITWDGYSYRYQEPGDWNRYRKIRDLGVRLVRYPEPLLRHYRERSNSGLEG
jgi:hypothetical protein